VDFWGNTKGLTVAGYGFAVPVMAPLIETFKARFDFDAKQTRGHGLAQHKSKYKYSL